MSSNALLVGFLYILAALSLLLSNVSCLAFRCMFVMCACESDWRIRSASRITASTDALVLASPSALVFCCAAAIAMFTFRRAFCISSLSRFRMAFTSPSVNVFWDRLFPLDSGCHVPLFECCVCYGSLTIAVAPSCRTCGCPPSL